MIIEFLIRMGLAILLGGIIGFERERRHKPAGLRTMMLITLACAAFASMSAFPCQDQLCDPTRIAANIVTGLGFIGAGVIIQTRGSVRGITTASVIWCSGALGMIIGFGYYPLAAVFAAGVIFITQGVGKFEGWMKKKEKKVKK